MDSLFLKKETQLSGSVGNRGGWRDVKCVKPRGTTLEEGIRKVTATLPRDWCNWKEQGRHKIWRFTAGTREPFHAFTAARFLVPFVPFRKKQTRLNASVTRLCPGSEWGQLHLHFIGSGWGWGLAGMDVHKERPQIAWAGLQEAFRTCRPTLQREAGWELLPPPPRSGYLNLRRRL